MKANKSNYYAYNARLQPFAKALRKDMTKAECCLWKYVLRAGNMRGYGFRRQRPVGRYIADFMCKKLMLIIEVDGITHQYEEPKGRDAEKDKYLRELGFSVIRFTDEDVLSHINVVYAEIEAWIDKHTPPPAPPPAGDTFI